jgi:N-acetylglucosaminyldiphosphoundecaprenol N-acetyl-beta-D-mannosaminyltransferase
MKSVARPPLDSAVDEGNRSPARNGRFNRTANANMLHREDTHPMTGTQQAIPAIALGRTNVLGVGISAVNMETALTRIASWISNREKHFVCVTGVHGVMESQSDPDLKAIHNSAGMVTPDGMPMVWLSRMAGAHHVDRVYGPDLMLELCRTSIQNGYRHFFYGGAEGIADLLAARLSEQFPGLKVTGTWTPPFRPLTEAEDSELISRINALQPDIVWVGLSTPKQERFMAAHVGRLNAPVMIGVGAAFDFHAGLKKQAPLWMQRSGLEWVFRLFTEPKRLWRRYLTNNPKFVAFVLAQKLGLRRFDME